jgi:hypothetical protein
MSGSIEATLFSVTVQRSWSEEDKDAGDAAFCAITPTYEGASLASRRSLTAQRIMPSLVGNIHRIPNCGADAGAPDHLV